MARRELLRNLGWKDELIAAFENRVADDIELDELDLELEEPDQTSTEIVLHIDVPIFQTNPILMPN